MQTDPETPEIPEESSSPEPYNEPKKRFSLPLHGPQAWLWMTVVVLILANTMFLFLSDTEPKAAIDPGQQLDQDAESFERLSFWKRLWTDEQEDPHARRSVFDGLVIDPDTEERAVSLMIDNHSLAREQHEGLRSASIVYEALVEGGITRIMLVFPYQELDRVGPVRSARDYFVDFAEEMGGIYVHAGGSPTALEQLWASDRVYSIEEDELSDEETYSFRDVNYEAPHNLFFDLLLTKEWAEEKGYELEETKREWCFVSNDQRGSEKPNINIENRNKSQDANSNGNNEQELETLESVSLVELNYSHDVSSSYYVQFQYDQEDGTYRRFYGSSNRTPHIDRGDQLQVAPRNLIVQIAPSYLIEGDEKERLSMQDVGSGDGFYYSKGKKYPITWTKPSNTAVTKYFDANGDPLCLEPGQTWVSIVDAEELVLENGEGADS